MYKEKISLPYYLFCALNTKIMDAISNPKTNPAIHEGVMVVLYNHKRKRKTGQEDQHKGSISKKQKGEDNDSWYEEEDENEDEMETYSEEVQIISS